MAFDNSMQPGTPDWDESVAQAAKALLHDQMAKQHCEELKAGLLDKDSSSSWTKIDLQDAVYGEHPEIKPTVLYRQDGQPLGYRGLTHSIHGPAGSAKTWFMLYAVAQQLRSGHDVLYLDYESFPVQIVKRLKELQVSPALIASHLDYRRPQTAPDTLDIDRSAFADVLENRYTLAVVDGANISMALCGLNPDSAVDVAQWHSAIMLPIAETTTAATFAVDHVPKNNAAYSGFAIGSQHKVAGLTGAAFVAEKIAPFGRGSKGYATLRVSPEKDREGYVHGIGVNDNQTDGLLVAELHIDGTTAPTRFELIAPRDETATEVADKRGKGKRKSNGPDDITYEMELVSGYWHEKHKDPSSGPTDRTQNKTVENLMARLKSNPKQYERRFTKDNLKLAVHALLDPGTQNGPFAELETVTLRGGGKPHRNLKRYERCAPVIKLSEVRNRRGAESPGDGTASTT